MPSNYPRLSIRVSHELKEACDKAGPDKVRAALSVLLSDNCQTIPSEVVRQTRQTPPVSPTLSDKTGDNGLSDKETGLHTVDKGHFVGQLSDKLGEREGAVDSPTIGQPLPAWKAKLAEQIDKAKALKAARE